MSIIVPLVGLFIGTVAFLLSLRENSWNPSAISRSRGARLGAGLGLASAGLLLHLWHPVTGSASWLKTVAMVAVIVCAVLCLVANIRTDFGKQGGKPS